LPHPAPQITASLQRQPKSAIRQSRVYTNPSTKSRCVSLRRFRNPTLPFPSLAPAGDSSPASSVLRECSDFPSSFPPRSLSFAGRYHGLPFVVTAGSCCWPAPRRYFMPVPQSSAFDSHSWRRRDLLGSSATPLRSCLLFDSGGPHAPGHCDARDVAFRAADDVGSAFSRISRLNHTACSLAVYASRLGLLRSNTSRVGRLTGRDARAAWLLVTSEAVPQHSGGRQDQAGHDRATNQNLPLDGQSSAAGVHQRRLVAQYQASRGAYGILSQAIH
jgi:hypothetical protein